MASFVSKLVDFFKKLFSILKDFAVRTGMEQWIKDNWQIVLSALIEEAKRQKDPKTGIIPPFHQWKHIVLATLKRVIVGDKEKDNWFEILMALGLETLKKRGVL